MWWAVWIGSFWPKIEVFYRPKGTKGGTTWKYTLSIFKFRNEYYKQLDRKKVDEKNGVICLVFMCPSWVTVLKLSKKVHFFQFCADISKKSRSIKVIYIYTSGRSHCALSEKGTVYYAMDYCFREISICNWKILLNFCWVSIFLIF